MAFELDEAAVHTRVSTFSGLPIPTPTDGTVPVEFVVPEPDKTALLIAGVAALVALRRLR